MEDLNAIKIAVAAVVGALTTLWGWMGWLVVIWTCAMILDYLTGTAAAMKAGAWSSKVAKEGIWHKVGMIAAVVVAAGCDLLFDILLTNIPIIQLPFTYPGFVCPVVLVWYTVTELGSIIENVAALGAPVPHWLSKLLAITSEAMGKEMETVTQGTTEEEEQEEEKALEDKPQEEMQDNLQKEKPNE